MADDPCLGPHPVDAKLQPRPNKSEPSLQPPQTVAVIMPVLDEEEHLSVRIDELLSDPSWNQICVVDGGSQDSGLERLIGSHARDVATGRLLLERTGPGRGLQMNHGAQCVRADILVFLHADTRLPPSAADRIRGALGGNRQWGRFDARLSGDYWLYRLVERGMNWRSRVTGIATGDQVLYVRRQAFERAGTYPEIALMEDIVLSRRLKRLSRPARILAPAITSSRRWDRDGAWKTLLRMWWLRLLFSLGVSPQRLARYYSHTR